MAKASDQPWPRVMRRPSARTRKRGQANYAYGQYYWYLSDHLGTPQKMIDEYGSVVWSGAYDSFGNCQILIETVTNNLRFPGQYYDAETGLLYNWHRYYDPQTGRYLGPDPLGLDGGINLYVYAQNNPLMFTDPEGLMVRKAVDYTENIIFPNTADAFVGFGDTISLGTTILIREEINETFWDGQDAVNYDATSYKVGQFAGDTFLEFSKFDDIIDVIEVGFGHNMAITKENRRISAFAELSTEERLLKGLLVGQAQKFDFLANKFDSKAIEKVSDIYTYGERIYSLSGSFAEKF